MLTNSFQKILGKLSNSTGECSNRSELWTTVWSNLQNLIEIDGEELDKWTQVVVKCTLESMLTVRVRRTDKKNADIFLGNGLIWLIGFHLTFQDCDKSESKDLEELKTKISNCAQLLEKNPNVFYRCKYIVENVDAPWSHPTLKLIFNDGNEAPKTISDEQFNKGKRDNVLFFQFDFRVFYFDFRKSLKFLFFLQKSNTLHRNEDV